MARVEDQKVVLYLKDSKATAGKRLNEIEKQLGGNFMRISKFTVVNLRQIGSVQPSINGFMYLTLKNGCRDSISRKYLPGFKRYLGL
jgi:DNA-binding LytR/AlgR family response regulator